MAGAGMQKLILKTLLSMPPPILRMMSGGEAVEAGGRVLDPHFQFLAHGARGMPPMSTLPPEIARAASDAGLAMMAGKDEPGVRWENAVVKVGDHEILTRVYTPADQDPAAPVLVYGHMGGGVIGTIDTCHTFLTIVAGLARCAVVSVDYRLAPEHRYPAAIEDMLDVYRHVREHTADYGGTAGHLAIGGDSMGGYFAAIVSQEMRRAGEPQPALQLLIYPAVDLASETQSMTATYADAYPLSADTMRWFIGHYAGPGADPADPRLSPIREPDLTGLAPAIVVTAGFDPLVDEGEAYARLLKAAGVPTLYRCYDSLAHGFTAFTGAVPAADVACREIAGLVRQAFEGKLC